MTGARILIVSQYFWPEAFRINDLAESLQRRGHAVTVLTAMPNYPTGRFFEGYGPWGPARQSYHEVVVRRVPIMPRFASRGWQLILNYLSFVMSASLLGPWYCRGQFDLILVYQPSPVTVGLPAILMAKLKRAPVLFWVQDVWPETLSATGTIRSPWILSLVERIVRLIYRRCHRILVQSRAFAAPVARLGVDPRRIQYFPNSAEALYRPVVPSGDIPGLPRGFRVMFAGNVGAAQSFETILAAAEYLRDVKDLHWVILGEGRMLNWVSSEVGRRDLGGIVHLLGHQPMHTMPEYFAQADVMLVTLRSDPIFAMTIPAKLQSYLACGRPVIAAVGGEASRVIEEAAAGLAVPPEDPRALAAAVRDVYHMPRQQREAMGQRGRLYFEEHFEREKLLGRLDGWIYEAIQPGDVCAS